MHVLAQALDQIGYAPLRRLRNLSMIPLLGSNSQPVAYATLDEALATGLFHVTEVSEAGRVPNLRVKNDLDTSVLLLDGEELIGAKQNRVVDLSILVPAHAEVVIPVSCVEAGRWRDLGRKFTSSERFHFLRGRMHRVAQVSYSLDEFSMAHSDQSDVWDRITDLSDRAHAHSPTSAMHDVYESRRSSVDEFVRALGAAEGQTGAAFCLNGRLAGVELFDSATTLSRLLPKIVASYAIDAAFSRENGDGPDPGPQEVRQWLDGLSQYTPSVHRAVGLGEAHRWNGTDVAAAALVVEEHLVHFVAFPLDGDRGSASGGTRMRSASWRRHAHRND